MNLKNCKYMMGAEFKALQARFEFAKFCDQAMAVSGLSIALFSVAAKAEELPDPTRPPASVTAPVVVSGQKAGEGPPSGLQTIIISKNRRAAIIDGQIVELRGKHGDATLIKVNEGSVVLQGAQGSQLLMLFPDVKILQKEVQAVPKLSVKDGEGGLVSRNS